MITFLNGKSIFLVEDFLYMCLRDIFSLEIYGAKITTLRAEIGSAPSIDALKNALNEKKYKMVTITHVDTS